MERKMNFVPELQLKDLDRKEGIVAFYYCPFEIKDRHGDTTLETAFDRTMRENKERVLHFRNHNDMEVPGVIQELGKDKKGAFAISKLAKKTIVGKDTLEQYDAGIIKQHSYGADPKASKFKADPDGGRILLDRDLWEVSSLTTFAASDQTPLISLKSFIEAERMLKSLNDALHSGTISDAECLKLAGEYKKLKKKLEAKEDFMEQLSMVRCEGCQQLVLNLNDDDNIATMVCSNCGKEINTGDGSMVATNTDDTGKKSFKASEVLKHIEFGNGGTLMEKALGQIDIAFKKKFNKAERDKAADSGAALPDGSFPILNGKDLENAIHDIGRASDEAAAKAHIIKRAKALGLESKLPADWK